MAIKKKKKKTFNDKKFLKSGELRPNISGLVCLLKENNVHKASPKRTRIIFHYQIYTYVWPTNNIRINIIKQLSINNALAWDQS